MADECQNCGAAIRDWSTFKSGNFRLPEEKVAFANFINGTAHAELCDKCGASQVTEAMSKLDAEIHTQTAFCQEHISAFPMFTVSWLPRMANIKLKNMVTANVTVGTGFFNEFSQGLSDIFGAVNTDTGMAFKVNKGEAAARSMLVAKAQGMGANCIVGVDIDYGVTGNNAATINMQGTAAVISNLGDVLDQPELEAFDAFNTARMRVIQLRKWKKGDLSA